jgi:hypothetical protein
MVWPFDWKYSRKRERISPDFTLEFYCSAKRPGDAGRTPREPA